MAIVIHTKNIRFFPDVFGKSYDNLFKKRRKKTNKLRSFFFLEILHPRHHA